MPEACIIETNGLKKTFTAKSKGKKKLVEAVKGVDLAVRRGEIFGFLGPNGAGKSTTQKMLSTLIPPTGGQARINGFDLLREQRKIRMCIGFVSQAGGTDPLSTGFENLVMQSRLYGADKTTAEKRAGDFIRRFQLESFADRRASSYSGGQRRRFDIALGMIHHPAILLLDEPTTGLDPQSRAYLWEEIRNLQNEGVSVFLTTHYLDEADKLCDTVAIINNGEIVAQGTPSELKAEIGADTVSLDFKTPDIAAKSSELLQSAEEVQSAKAKDNTVHLYVKNMEQVLPALLRLLDTNRFEAQSIALAKPSLDDVFLKHTGRSLREDTYNETAQ
jgi:ABC-2 type transport system ATP-binding protein